MRGCMTVSVVDDGAHGVHTSTASTGSSLSAARPSSMHEARSAQWEAAAQRKRSNSIESWFHKMRSQDPEKVARRESRRAKRKAFFRKIFHRSKEEDDEDSEDEDEELQQLRKSVAVDLSAPEDEAAARRLNDLYYASIKTIMDQYTSDRMSEGGTDNNEDDDDDDDDDDKGKDAFDTSDLDSNTDMSEISVFDLEEEDTDYEDDDYDSEDNSSREYGLGAIDESEEASPSVPVNDVVREMPTYVAPPVRVPLEYTLQDRRGGTLVGGRHVLFTSAAFKRKQRMFLYSFRPIPEDAQYIVPQIKDDDDSDDELITDGVYAPESSWV